MKNDVDDDADEEDYGDELIDLGDDIQPFSMSFKVTEEQPNHCNRNSYVQQKDLIEENKDLANTSALNIEDCNDSVEERDEELSDQDEDNDFIKQDFNKTQKYPK